MVDVVGTAGSAPQGPAIDVIFNIGGGRCWTHQQCLRGGPPSTSSSTSMVNAARPVGSAPQGPAIDIIFNIGGGHCRTRRQCPQGARHRHLPQAQWWTLLDPPTAPPRGPPSSSTSTTNDVMQQVVVFVGIYCQRLSGATGKLSLLSVLQARHFKKISSNITKTKFIYKTKSVGAKK
jgi:hypothetical protein